MDIVSRNHLDVDVSFSLTYEQTRNESCSSLHCIRWTCCADPTHVDNKVYRISHGDMCVQQLGICIKSTLKQFSIQFSKYTWALAMKNSVALRSLGIIIDNNYRPQNGALYDTKFDVINAN